MKQQFYSLLLAALLGMTGMQAWADDYEIATAQDLVDFAAVVNDGDFTANGVLTADIDMSGLMEDEWVAIGDWGAVSGTSEAGYKGHFDGQGHTIKNFNFSATHNYFSLFGVIWGTALVENFTIEGNITINSNIGYAAGAVAYTNNTPTVRNVHSKVNISSTSTAKTPRIGGVVGGCPAQSSTTTIDRCTYSGTLNANEKGGNYGGIVGYILNNNTTKVNITNCLFDGKLQGSVNDNKAQLGGLIGYTRAGIVSVENCLSVGTFEYESGNAMNIGQFVGRITYDSGNTGLTFNNNYYKNTGIPVAGTSSGGPGKGTAPIEATDDQLASGEIAYLLNESVSGGENWFQALKTMTFSAQQYVITANGTPRAPETAQTILSYNGSGSYDFILPNFVLHTNMMDIEVGDVVLEDVTIEDDGTFEKEGQFSVPDENIPTFMSMYKPYLQNIKYTLSGKVNGEKLYANIDGINVSLPSLGTFAVSVEVGTDDFAAAAPIAEAYPTPNGTLLVYLNGHEHCDGTAYAGTGFSNQDLGVESDDHNYADGFCDYCGALDVEYMTANEDDFFEIENEKQLLWFAAYVNQVNPAANGMLMDNIALTKAWTNPIGNSSAAYSGTFDGQGKSITGFSAISTGNSGLFGYIINATIIDFSIDGSLDVIGGTASGVIGYSKSSTISGIHSSLTITTSAETAVGHVGGVVGSLNQNDNVSDCSFSGSITANANSHNCFGGIVGYMTSNDKIQNCANYGSITYSKNTCYAGGIEGYINATTASVQNCLSTGAVTYVGEGTATYGGAIVGYMKSAYNSSNFSDNYWLEGSADKAYGSKTDEANEATAEQLASGEVAYKLGEAWSQLIGTDEYPLLGCDAPVFYVGAAGYATMFDTTSGYELNGDVTAFVATAHESWLQLTAIGNVPESTPVILKGTYYNKFEQDVPAITVDNDLLGTAVDTEADGTTMYILAKPEGMEVGFYLATGTIPAGKAYYKSTSGVKGYLFTDDDATGIASVNKQTEEPIYNIAGQRLQKMQKGINIVGSKKVLY